MNNTAAHAGIQKFAAHYEQLRKLLDEQEADLKSQAKDIKKLRERVRLLTEQRDQAHARNQELRAHLARYQQQLAERRRSVEAVA